MSTKPTTENRSDYTRPARFGRLGTDTEGYHHVIDRENGVVMRFDGPYIERVSDLEGESAVTYRRYVEDLIGWTTRETLLPVVLMDATEGR